MYFYDADSFFDIDHSSRQQIKGSIPKKQLKKTQNEEQ
jgi:hypothetical protein